MGYRKILVPFTGSDRHSGVLPLAMSVAKEFGAYCEILFIRPEPYQALPYLGDAAPGVVVKEIVESANQAADASMKHLKAAASKAAEGVGAKLTEGAVPAGTFSVKLVERTGDSITVGAEQSRLCDLAIMLGGAAHPEIVTAGALSGILLRTGRPVLVLPGTNYRGMIGRTAIIAWDGSTEAANAIRGALPFLRKAGTVRVLTAKQVPEDTAHVEPSMETLGTYLDVCDVKYVHATVDPGAKGVARTLLDEAASAKADLLVMGAYSHSRVREFLLGGVTQHILEHTSIPVLIAH